MVPSTLDASSTLDSSPPSVVLDVVLEESEQATPTRTIEADTTLAPDTKRKLPIHAPYRARITAPRDEPKHQKTLIVRTRLVAAGGRP